MSRDPWGLLTALIAITTLPLALLIAMFVGLQTAAVVVIVGWFLLVPLVPIVGIEILPMVANRMNGGSGSADESATTGTPKEELKRRYVRGEIDDVVFERRMRRIVEVDHAESVFAERATDDDPGGRT